MNGGLIDRCRFRWKWKSTRFWLHVAEFAILRANRQWPQRSGVADYTEEAASAVRNARSITP